VHPEDSLLVLCALLFLDGATLGSGTTPLLLLYGAHHTPWQVAALGGLASACGNTVQILVFRWLLHHERPWARRFLPSRETVVRTLARYPSASFLAILVARATPLPDAPVKLVVAFIGYPLPLYFLAVLLGALPYYWVLAEVGHRVDIPAPWLVAAFVVLVLVAVVDRWRKARRREPEPPA
jgi:uncharacterized membrane protein YdjX (TVP38/TMEM64 family)